MTEKVLFDCFVQCSANRSFLLQDDDVEAWRNKQPPIIDILVVSEENMDIIPSDYFVVMNQEENCSPQGSIPISSKKRGYLCIKRSFGRGFISSLRFFAKSQLKSDAAKDYYMVKQYPECNLVSFADSRSSEELYLGMKVSLRNRNNDYGCEPEEKTLSSLLLLSLISDPFDYPDHSSISVFAASMTKPSLQILTKTQSQLHRYQLFRMQPSLNHSIVASGHKLPAGIECLVFQEGVPIQIVRADDITSMQSKLTYGSFMIYCANGEMRYGYSLFYWKQATDKQKMQCIEAMKNSIHEHEMNDKIRHGFEASISNYCKPDCFLFSQCSLSLVSTLPYSKSFNRLLSSLYSISFAQQKERTLLDTVQVVTSLTRPETLKKLFTSSHIQHRVNQLILKHTATNLVRCSPYPELGDSVIITIDDIDSIKVYRHYSRGFPVYDDNIAPLFLLLSPQHITFLLQSILLEGKIVIHSAYPSLIVNVSHTLRRLLFPWKYAGSFIPLLPSSMLLAVEVPGSYIIGVETKWLSHCQLPQESLLVDLDSDRLIMEKTHISSPLLPDYIIHIFQSVIQSIRDSLISSFNTESFCWQQCWNTPDTLHRLPKLSRKESIQLFTSILDVYSSMVEHYEKMVMYRDNGDYTGCTLNQMFNTDDFIASSNRMMQSFMKQFVKTQLFSNFISSKVETAILKQTDPTNPFDFPVIFFDKYLTLIHRPFKDRYSHLHRVLYQKSNRMILISISPFTKETETESMSVKPLSIDHLMSFSVSCDMDDDDERRIAETVIDCWIQGCERRWNSKGILVKVKKSQIDILPVSIALKAKLSLMIENSSIVNQPLIHPMMTADCYCEYCHTSIDVDHHVVRWSTYICPYCSSTLQPILTMMNGEDTESHILLTPFQLSSMNETGLIDDNNDKRVQLSSWYLTTMWFSVPLFSSTAIEDSLVMIMPTTLLACLCQLIAQADEDDSISEITPHQYQILLSLMTASIQRLHSQPVPLNNEQLLHSNIMIERLSKAVICCSPSRDREIIEASTAVSGIIQEIIQYLNSDDIINACKLYLFCRGGSVHVGFEKSMYHTFYLLRMINSFDLSNINDVMSQFLTNYENTCLLLRPPATIYFKSFDMPLDLSYHICLTNITLLIFIINRPVS